MRRTNFTNTEVASSETARAINRGVILNLIRRRQPISRADLARVSGLQRSTVSLITEQLIREHWVVYGPTGRLPRGRRPTFLRLNDRRAIVVAPNLKWSEFDLRGPLEQATGMRVELENAANACVLAEVWFGHAERVRDLDVVTIAG